MMTTRRFFEIVNKANDKNYIKYLENKLLFNEFFHAFIQRKWFDSQSITFEQFKELLETPHGVIIKPLNGMEGKGIIQFRGLSTNSQKDFEEIKLKQTIIEECIVQHPKMVFGNNSVNTIRAITLYDNKSRQAKLIKTVLRVGVGSALVDNFHQGGCAYEVDIASGRICSKGVSATQDNIIIHPGTNICMLGYKIPNWGNVVESCLMAQSMLPQCRYISWDIAITEYGIEFIEGNHNGDYDMLEFVGSNGYYRMISQQIVESTRSD